MVRHVIITDNIVNLIHEGLPTDLVLSYEALAPAAELESIKVTGMSARLGMIAYSLAHKSRRQIERQALIIMHYMGQQSI